MRSNNTHYHVLTAIEVSAFKDPQTFLPGSIFPPKLDFFYGIYSHSRKTGLLDYDYDYDYDYDEKRLL
jgi:hypothetical protein